MPVSSQFVFTGYSLATLCCWGTGDFIGGYAAKRANAFVLAALAHACGLILMTTVALLSGGPFPSRTSALWAIAAGLSGGAALAIFYRALASGKMGLIAPTSAVLAAVISVSYGIFIEGLPHAIQLMKQTGGSSALWSAALARLSSFVLVCAIVLVGVTERSIQRTGVLLGGLAGCLDVTGTALYVRASQTGRLDAAVVLTSLYPAVTVLLARLFLKEHFTRWKVVGMLAAILAVPMIAL